MNLSPNQQIIFIDLETTGTNPNLHAPISLGAVILGGPNSGNTLNLKMRPHLGAEIHPKALEVNGYREDELMQWELPKVQATALLNWLASNAIPNERILLGGFYFSFDLNFLKALMARFGQGPNFGYMINEEYVEVQKEVTGTYPDYKTRFPNKKLVTLYSHIFGKPLAMAHNEMADIIATRDLFLHCDRHSQRNLYQEHHCLLP